MRIPMSGGVPQFVLEMRNWLTFACARAPATLCVILEASQDEKRLTLTTFDPLKGKGKVLRMIEKDPATHVNGNLLPTDQRLRLRKLARPRFTFAYFHSRAAPTAKSR
jgi:hypothetical protein